MKQPYQYRYMSIYLNIRFTLLFTSAPPLFNPFTTLQTISGRMKLAPTIKEVTSPLTLASKFLLLLIIIQIPVLHSVSLSRLNYPLCLHSMTLHTTPFISSPFSLSTLSLYLFRSTAPMCHSLYSLSLTPLLKIHKTTKHALSRTSSHLTPNKTIFRNNCTSYVHDL